MKFLSQQTILQSWKNITNIGEQHRMSLNKFFGLLEILAIISEDDNKIKTNKQYQVIQSSLSNSLQDKFCFNNEKKSFNSKDLLYITFPIDWNINIFKIMLKEIQLPLIDVACICLQNKEFDDNIEMQNIIEIFTCTYNLTGIAEVFFSTKSETNIHFNNNLPNREHIFTELKLSFDVVNQGPENYTLGLEKKLISANPGELSRGPFIQPLYSGQDNLKCLLIANFNITEYYKIGEETTAKQAKNKHFNKILHQIIFYGSPGTGKSREVERITKDKKLTRTTFHPETDYHSFVGSYKPVMDGNTIKYNFVPQAFTKAYCNAWQNPEQPYYLIIEEINRGNCAQIFGDLFQCLDRDEDGYSKYEINCDHDLANYLKSEFERSLSQEAMENYKAKIKTENFDIIVIPNNLYIFATMNTSDQSLFPMDSAFKRRWDWEFVPINYDDAYSLNIIIGDSTYNWGEFIKNINPKIKELTGSEDKQLGNRFVNPKDGNITFDQFRSKVLFYLWSEVYKDEFGTQSSIFKYELEENNPIDFQFGELYNSNAIDIVKAFLKFNGL